MFENLLQSLLQLRRKAGLALGSALVIALVGGLYAWEAYRLPRTRTGSLTPLMRGEYTFHDMLMQRGHKVPVRDDVMFLGYDEDSLRLDGLWPDEIEASPALKAIAVSQGRWPWPRSVQAMILDRLANAGAKVVAFDLLLLGPSPDDAAMRAALDAHAAQVVIGANLDIGASTINLPSETLVPMSSPPDSRVGYVEYIPDHDGKVRSMSFRIAPSDRSRNTNAVVYDSFVARILRKLGRSDLVDAAGVDRLYPFRFSKDYKARPVYEIFSDALWQQNYHGGADFKNKIVLIGPMAGSMHDTHDTPLGLMPGPALHLNALGAALAGDFLHPTPLWVELAIIFVAGVLAWGVGVAIRQPLARMMAMVACGVLYVLLLFGLFDRFGLLTVGFSPLLCFFVSAMGGLVGEFVAERAEKAHVRGVLDRLVSKDIVRELLEDRDSYKSLVKGTRRPVTVFFSDVRDFTTLSEAAADPQAFIAQLNEYLGEMVDIVFRHRGTVDKFIGDAVMAVWGSMHTEGPEKDAALAVEAALEMRERLVQLNKKWTVEGKQTLAFGMGLNAGDVIVGGLGNENTKMEITVMGDAVNLASRLEGLTKTYHLELLIGESVARLVGGKFRLRTVDLVRVKGKKKPVEVMTVEGLLTETPSDRRKEFLAGYEDALLLYRRRDFAAAKRCLERCLEIMPDDYLVGYYLHLCDEYLTAAPAEDWDGVRLMTSK